MPNAISTSIQSIKNARECSQMVNHNRILNIWYACEVPYCTAFKRIAVLFWFGSYVPHDPTNLWTCVLLYEHNLILFPPYQDSAASHLYDFEFASNRLHKTSSKWTNSILMAMYMRLWMKNYLHKSNMGWLILLNHVLYSCVSFGLLARE